LGALIQGHLVDPAYCVSAYGKNEIDKSKYYVAGKMRLSEVRIISVKIPEEVYQEMALRIPEGDRSNFVREAISEKLQKTPKADKLLALEERMGKIEEEFGQVRKYLADLEILTFQHGKINPHSFCIDEVDHKIMEYLLHYKSATTPELATYVKTNRWLILNRLRKIQKTSKKQFGKPVIEYYAGEKSGKKKAWWIDEELIQE
jgi:Arc/MetJ-type ribon-helix-helix transcriptional regulator